MAAVPDCTPDLVRLADGDRTAFDAVYAVAWPRVRALVRRMARDAPDSEDIAQQAMIRVFERAHHFDPARGRALPWILGIAAWEVRTARRRHTRSREAPLTSEPIGRGPDPHTRSEQAELLAHLEAAMGQLPPDDVATLLAAAGLAERPDSVSPTTFRKRLQRARQRLRAAWGGFHG